MLRSASLVGFIPTKNFKKAKAFFGQRLGLQLLSEDGFALVYDVSGIPIRIAKVDDFKPAYFTILGWEVKNIAKIVSGLKKKGVKFMRYPGMGQDKLGIWTSPSGAKVAWFKDPDGNV